MSKDYLASAKPEPKDVKHFGVKGMKWGVRRSRSELASKAPKGSTDGHTVKISGPKAEVNHVNKLIEANNKSVDAKPKSNIQDHVESSSTRYARLAQQAKSGGASKMTEQDLKFFNARTEALAKIDKMNKQDPSWLSKTTKTVLQQTAQNSMQSVADGVSKKYISGPILEAINKK